MKCPSLTCNAIERVDNCCRSYFKNIGNACSCNSQDKDPCIISINENYFRLCGNDCCPDIVHGDGKADVLGVRIYGWHSYDITGTPQYFCLECDGCRIKFHPKNLLFESLIKLANLVYFLVYNVLAVSLALIASTLECFWNLIVKILALFFVSCCINKSDAMNEMNCYCLHCERSEEKYEKCCGCCHWEKSEVVTSQPGSSRKRRRRPSSRNFGSGKIRKHSKHGPGMSPRHSRGHRRSHHKYIGRDTEIKSHDKVIDEQAFQAMSKRSFTHEKHVNINAKLLKNVDVPRASTSGSPMNVSGSPASKRGSLPLNQNFASNTPISEASFQITSQPDKLVTSDRLQTPRRARYSQKHGYQNSPSSSTSSSDDTDDNYYNNDYDDDDSDDDEDDDEDDDGDDGDDMIYESDDDVFSDDEIISTAFSHTKKMTLTKVKDGNNSYSYGEHVVKQEPTMSPNVKIKHQVNKEDITGSSQYVNIEHYVNMPSSVEDVANSDIGTVLNSSLQETKQQITTDDGNTELYFTVNHRVNSPPSGTDMAGSDNDPASTAGELILEDLEYTSDYSGQGINMPETSL
ncbi:hypothetical protein DPMN_009131 [Dreissena polymorpha]|uniref:Uncharacterized protein n=2 Tax=Dreissena polymorpha TaxID=45954 RepID=A0A9D4MZ18_DREPO|nr:hypothetical protein DPMN_009131 [Dreissena polymorpha]